MIHTMSSRWFRGRWDENRPVSASLQRITEVEFEQLTASLNPLNRRSK